MREGVALSYRGGCLTGVVRSRTCFNLVLGWRGYARLGARWIARGRGCVDVVLISFGIDATENKVSAVVCLFFG